MNVNRVRHLWPEGPGFELLRKDGTDDYVLLHFISPVKIQYGGKLVSAPQNSFIAYSPKMYQYFFSEGKLLHNWAHVSGDVQKLFNLSGLQTDTLYSLSNGEFVTEIFREIETENSKQGEFSNEIINLKLMELVYKLARNINSNIDVNIEHETSKKLSEIRSTVFSSLNKKWQVSQMADMMYLSESYFYSLYRQQYGITPNKDLILARIDRAKTLITRGMKIGEVAKNCGYESEYHFIHQFKKYVGASPKQYAMSRK